MRRCPSPREWGGNPFSWLQSVAEKNPAQHCCGNLQTSHQDYWDSWDQYKEERKRLRESHVRDRETQASVGHPPTLDNVHNVHPAWVKELTVTWSCVSESSSSGPQLNSWQHDQQEHRWLDSSDDGFWWFVWWFENTTHSSSKRTFTRVACRCFGFGLFSYRNFSRVSILPVLLLALTLQMIFLNGDRKVGNTVYREKTRRTPRNRTEKE